MIKQNNHNEHKIKFDQFYKYLNKFKETQINIE